MRPAGLLCKIDKLGRIVIPKPLRREFDIDTGDTIEFFTEPDAIVLKKYAMRCVFCSGRDDLTEYRGKPICSSCLDKLKTL